MGISSELVSMTCVNCGKKLAEVKLKDGVISIKCGKCGVVNTTESTTKNAKSVKG